MKWQNHRQRTCSKVLYLILSSGKKNPINPKAFFEVFEQAIGVKHFSGLYIMRNKKFKIFVHNLRSPCEECYCIYCKNWLKILLKILKFKSNFHVFNFTKNYSKNYSLLLSKPNIHLRLIRNLYYPQLWRKIWSTIPVMRVHLVTIYF